MAVWKHLVHAAVITLPELSSSASHLKYEPHRYFKDYAISISDPLSSTILVSFKFSKQNLSMFRRQRFLAVKFITKHIEKDIV